jgi:hypothetical protein
LRRCGGQGTLRFMVVESAPDGSWSVVQAGEGAVLVMKFVGPTTTPSFAAFLAHLTAKMPESGVTLVFDLRQLDGYNPETKEPIKEWLRLHKLAIREVIVVVSKSETILRMVTAAIGLAVGVKITIREEVPEIEPPSEVVRL